MEHKGTTKLKKIGGSYLFLINKQWIKDNRIDELNKVDDKDKVDDIEYSILDHVITLRPAVSPFRVEKPNEPQKQTEGQGNDGNDDKGIAIAMIELPEPSKSMTPPEELPDLNKL